VCSGWEKVTYIKITIVQGERKKNCLQDRSEKRALWAFRAGKSICIPWQSLECSKNTE
jgi:hypothetical protein